jgi:glutaredoxin 2
MEVILYHYVHCPFCVRVRLTLGLLKISFTSVVLPYDDEETPIRLTGTKMLPILSMDGKPMSESLDIMRALDREDRLRIADVTSTPAFREFEAYLNFLGSPIHSLAMPYWIYTPEFTEESRRYFQRKKELKRGPFPELVRRSQVFMDQLGAEFERLAPKLQPFYESQELGLHDILLASHLWGLYVVPEFQFPPEVHSYLQRVKKASSFSYHADFWG